MRGGVKHDRRAIGLQDLRHARWVGDVGDAGNDVRFGAQSLELLLHREQAVFGPLDEQHRLGTELEHLPADLRADAAAGPGDHHGSSGNQRADRVVVELHRLAPQKVVNIDVADLRRITARQQIVVSRDNLERDVGGVAAFHQTAQLRPGQHARDDQQVFDAQLPGDIQGPRRLAPNGNARERRPDARRVLIQVTDRVILQPAIGQQVPGQRFTRLIGAHDQRPAISAPPQSRTELFARQAGRGPQRPQHEDDHSPIQHQHAAGQA